MKPHFLRPVYAAQQTGSHPGIIMMGRWPDQRHLMTALDIVLKIKHDRHMGMTTADQYQMFPHFYPPQPSSL
jgi:hypothetical protein